MSKLQTLIENLNSQKARLLRDMRKVEILTSFVEDARARLESETDKELVASVSSILDRFLEGAVAEIEGGVPKVSEASVAQTTEAAKVSPKQKSAPVQDANSTVSVNDQFNFALEHRSLGGKAVQATNGDRTVRGTVVGMDAPFILVKTEDGPTIKVPPANISLA